MPSSFEISPTSQHRKRQPTKMDAHYGQVMKAREAAGNGLRRYFGYSTILDRASFDRADMTGAKLAGGNLQKAELGRALLKGVDLTQADLTGAFLARADLRGAKLDRANLKNATLQFADLRDTDLSGAVNLTAAQIEATCGNAGTRLPQGIAMPAEWQCSGRE